MERIDLSRAAALLKGADRVLIVTHVRPDGDAAGSGCALCLGLRALGKTAYVAADLPVMARYEKYMIPYLAPAGFVPGFIAAVDTPGPGQFPRGLEALAERTDLAVDHHGTNSGYARALYLEPDSASTGELVYLLLRAMDVALTAEMAEALYVALATDTGGFRTPGTTGRTLTIAGALHDRTPCPSALMRRLFENKSAARLRLEAALYGGMRFPLPGVCVMTLPRETIAACGAEENDMDKLSLLTMTPEGVRAGLLLRELDDGTWKLSLRTEGAPHAGQILSAAAGGGGHADAAGAVAPGPAQALEDAVLAALAEALP